MIDIKIARIARRASPTALIRYDKKSTVVNSENGGISRRFSQEPMLLRFLLVGLLAHQTIAGKGKGKEKDDKPKKAKKAAKGKGLKGGNNGFEVNYNCFGTL